MNIFVIGFVVLILYSFVDFKRAFLLYIVIKVLLNSNINFLNIPGLPVLTVEFVINFVFLVLFILKRNSFDRVDPFPFKIGFIVSIISITISTVFSSLGIIDSLPRALQEVVNNFILIYIFWRVVSRKEDIYFLIKGFAIMALLSAVYAFYEKMNDFNNPIIEYQLSFNGGRGIEFDYGDERLGVGRVKSFATHAIGYGVYLGLMISFLLYMIQNKLVERSNDKYLFISVILLSLFALLFTNSRSPIVFLAVSLIPFLKFSIRNVLLGCMVVIVLVVMSDWTGVYVDNALSIFSDSTEVGGSDSEMRIEQLMVAIDVFSESPIVGFGIKSMENYLKADIGLLGAESIWFWLMIERGIIGCLSYVVLIASILFWAIRNRNFHIAFIASSWLIINTITSIPGIEISFFLILILIMHKYNRLTVNLENYE